MDPSIRNLSSDEEVGVKRSSSRWATPLITLATVCLLVGLFLFLRPDETPHRPRSTTAVLDMYVERGIGVQEARELVDSLGADDMILGWRLVLASPFRDARVLTDPCRGDEAIRLLVSGTRDAMVIGDSAQDRSEFGAMWTQLGDMGHTLQCQRLVPQWRSW